MKLQNLPIDKVEKAALILLAIISLVGGSLFGYVTAQIKNSAGIDNLRQFQPSLPTKLYDINGELIAELFQEKRELISFDELPKNLITPSSPPKTVTSSTTSGSIRPPYSGPW